MKATLTATALPRSAILIPLSLQAPSVRRLAVLVEVTALLHEAMYAVAGRTPPDKLLATLRLVVSSAFWMMAAWLVIPDKQHKVAPKA